jgi:hypothetical protein
MPSPTYTVTVLSVATDGTNIFLEIQICNGPTTSPIIRPVFEVGTTAATIITYLQAIATARPAVDAGIVALQGTTYTG